MCEALSDLLFSRSLSHREEQQKDGAFREASSDHAWRGRVFYDITLIAPFLPPPPPLLSPSLGTFSRYLFCKRSRPLISSSRAIIPPFAVVSRVLQHHSPLAVKRTFRLTDLYAQTTLTLVQYFSPRSPLAVEERKKFNFWRKQNEALFCYFV